MLRRNIKYLGFDDRWLVLLGIPVTAFLIPFLFFGVEFSFYWQVAHQEYLENLVYTAAFWALNRFLIIQFRKRFDTLKQSLRRLSLQFLTVFLAIPIVEALVTLIVHQIYRLLDATDLFQPTPLQAAMSTYFLAISIAAIYEAVYFFNKYKDAIVEKEQIQRAHIQGQLDNLRNQINPHFLFNSMNTLMNLIPTDQERAMDYLSKLSRFYRYAVSKQEETLVPLQKELENVQLYAELLKERFPYSLQIDLPEATSTEVQILPLCLQLLIENAVKHNIVSTKKPLNIEIKETDNGKYISVRNNIQKKIQEVGSTGMGLKNIKSRIAFFTNEPLLVSEDDSYFTVSVPLIQSN